jgi:predicted ATPase
MPTSELLSLAINQIKNQRLLLVATARSEFAPPWPSYRHISTLSLTRLDWREGEALVHAVTKGKRLPANVLDQILARTDGVPLFLEELTKTVLESGLLVEAKTAFELSGSLPALRIPSTLHASLLARLDRLASVKDVAQIGAALGRQFSHELISAVAPMQQRQVDDALAQLVNAELIFRRGTPPDAEYIFKHALVQDAAYETLLRGTRRQLHARIATTLEDKFPEVVAAQPALLARHCAEAGLIEKAIGYWLTAGQQAVQRSQNQEAISHLANGLTKLKDLPDNLEKVRVELAFQTTLGPALLATKGWASPAAIDTYIRARALCEQVGDSAQLFTTLWGTWLFRWARGEITVACGLVDELLGLAQREPNATFYLQAHYAAWTTFTYLGQVETALDHAERGTLLYRPKQHGSLAAQFGGHDPGVCAKAHASQPLWLLGYPDKAVQSSQQSIALAQRLSHGPSVVHALFHAVWLDQFRRDAHAAEDRAETLISMASDQGQLQYIAIGTIFKGWALAIKGETKKGLELIRDGFAEYQATGAQSWAPYYNALLAELLRKVKNYDEALNVLNEAQSTAKKAAHQFFWEAEMFRLEGELLRSDLRRQGGVDDCFAKAVAIARDLRAKSLELRASISLARLWRDRGRLDEARDLLRVIYGWFTEGFDTPDLKDAQLLLTELNV